MIHQIEIRLTAKTRGCHLITREIMRHLPELPESGILNVFVKHTSCGLTINENADPDVRTDLDNILDHIVPERQPYYEHTMEGDDDMPAHAKSSLTGVSLTIPITNHRLNLGTWQGIYLCEFRDYGGERTLVLTIYS
ncbi:MAG: YjbQ family protein [Bacteroidales bacterium]|nr:YjbQ family protein [Bacteroidales bacterium]